MRPKYAFVLALVVAIAVFALQNTAPAAVRFLVWTYDGVPLATVILLSVAVGIVVVGVPLWLSRWHLRARVRALETQLERLTERRNQPGTGPD